MQNERVEVRTLVDRIIQRRHGRLPEIEKKRQTLFALQNALGRYNDLKSQILNPDGTVRSGKYTYLAEENPEMVTNLNALTTAECDAKIKVALDECDKAADRFGRENINISVVGRARIGKSLLLQGISNLSNYVIPAFTETDCTGAVSVIENKEGMFDHAPEGMKQEAHLTFKTEPQMIKILQDYLDAMIPENNGRIMLYHMAQICEPGFLEKVEAKLVSGSSNNGLLEYLKKYVDHYDEWAPLINSKSQIIRDEREIQLYVAQNDGNKNPELRRHFYKYLAVNSCNIYCTFDYAQAGKINLIDTVGLGDNALGIAKDMLDVVNKKSDAVIFVHLPFSSEGGYVNDTITKAYDQIEKNCRGKDLKKWLFWLINEAPGHPKTPNDRARCEECVKTLANKKWHSAMTRIIDISNKEQLREEYLIPMLYTLMNNLDDIDALYMQDLVKALDDVRKVYNGFCNHAKKIMSSRIKAAANLAPQMIEDIEAMEKIRIGMLRTLSNDEKKLRNVPCPELNNRVQEIVTSVKKGTFLPSEAEVLNSIQHASSPNVVYSDYCDKLRNKVSQYFTDVDTTMTKLVEEAKNKVTNILCTDCRLGTILPMDPAKKTYEWLNDFAEMNLDPEQYPILHSAFRTVHQFDFTVRGFLTYEVRACLDKIDPQITAPYLEIDPVDDHYTATMLHFKLRKNLKDVADELSVSMGDLFSKPHRAFFAMMKEFSDKVNFTEGVRREWSQLYSDNYTRVWQDKVQSISRADAAFSEWNDMLQELTSRSVECASLQVMS